MERNRHITLMIFSVIVLVFLFEQAAFLLGNNIEVYGTANYFGNYFLTSYSNLPLYIILMFTFLMAGALVILSARFKAPFKIILIFCALAALSGALVLLRVCLSGELSYHDPRRDVLGMLLILFAGPVIYYIAVSLDQKI
jgi:hypothetical protein